MVAAATAVAWAVAMVQATEATAAARLAAWVAGGGLGGGGGGLWPCRVPVRAHARRPQSARARREHMVRAVARTMLGDGCGAVGSVGGGRRPRRRQRRDVVGLCGGGGAIAAADQAPRPVSPQSCASACDQGAVSTCACSGIRLVRAVARTLRRK